MVMLRNELSKSEGLFSEFMSCLVNSIACRLQIKEEVEIVMNIEGWGGACKNIRGLRAYRSW